MSQQGSIAAAVGYTGPREVAARSTGGRAQVEEELSTLDDAITRLGATVEGLVGRLVPVLRTDGPTMADGAPVPVLVPLAEHLFHLRNRVDQIQRVAADASDRLEL